MLKVVKINSFLHNQAMTFSDSATTGGTQKFAGRFPNSANGHFKKSQDLTLSSIGIGTYLGNWDEATDKNYVDSIVKFVELGGNVIDTAANYRFQRSERNIGEALNILSEKEFDRNELLICTKGGFLPFEGEPPSDVHKYFEENFVKKGIASFDDLIGGSHCMTPDYLQSQIDQSLQNMNLETVDVFYIHNPESQLSEVSKVDFEVNLTLAFKQLEKNRQDGKIKFYGEATGNGFRLQQNERNYHSLEKMWKIAEKIGGEDHGFRFIQLPFNLAMPEALLFRNQQFNGQVFSTMEVAENLGISVMCSASILQGKLATGLPSNIKEGLGNLESDAQAGLQFVRSTSQVTSALVGMSKTNHVEENLELMNVPVLSNEDYQKLFNQQ